MYYAIGMDREYAEMFLEKVGAAATGDASAPQAILRGVYAAIIRGNFDDLDKFFADDVELDMCGFAPMNGTWRGREEVIQATRRNYAIATNQQPKVECVISEGPRIAVLISENGTLRSNGHAYNLRGVHLFTFAEGKIKKIEGIAASTL